MSVIREAYRSCLPPNGKELTVLCAIAELEQKNGGAPSCSQIAAVYGFTKQAAHYWVKRLRAKQLVEPGPGHLHTYGSRAPRITLTDAGRIAVATSA